jgi:hypothetical protein
MYTWITKLLRTERNARSNRLLNVQKSSDRYWWVFVINAIGRPFRELMYARATLSQGGNASQYGHNGYIIRVHYLSYPYARQIQMRCVRI